MNEFSKYVGLDVHKETIAVSVAEANGGEIHYIGEIANTPEAIEKLVKHLRKGGANFFTSGVARQGCNKLHQLISRIDEKILHGLV